MKKTLQSILARLTHEPEPQPKRPGRQLRRHDTFNKLKELDERERRERPALVEKRRRAEREVAKLEGALQDARANLNLAAAPLQQFDSAIAHERECCRGIIYATAPPCLDDARGYVDAICAHFIDLQRLGTVETYTLTDSMPAREAPRSFFDSGAPTDLEAEKKWAEAAACSLSRDPFFGRKIYLTGQVLNGPELDAASAEITAARRGLLELRKQQLLDSEFEERCVAILEPLEKYANLL
jgi:hypothetical protein